MEEKVSQSNKISLDLLAQLNDREVELRQVPWAWKSFKSGMSYLPVKTDLIDEKLSDFINNHP